MSLNPSNLMAERANPGRTTFPNLACHEPTEEDKQRVDEQVVKELTEAGIELSGSELLRKHGGEVPTMYIGELCMWGFKRAWYYWVATGPGIPADKAEKFHKTWGTQVRVAGHCGCPSPLEWYHGFAVGDYHVDTQEGLNALAALLKSIYVPEPEDGQ